VAVADPDPDHYRPKAQAYNPRQQRNQGGQPSPYYPPPQGYQTPPQYPPQPYPQGQYLQQPNPYAQRMPTNKVEMLAAFWSQSTANTSYFNPVFQSHTTSQHIHTRHRNLSSQGDEAESLAGQQISTP